MQCIKVIEFGLWTYCDGSEHSFVGGVVSVNKFCFQLVTTVKSGRACVYKHIQRVFVLSNSAQPEKVSSSCCCPFLVFIFRCFRSALDMFKFCWYRQLCDSVDINRCLTDMCLSFWSCTCHSVHIDLIADLGHSQ